MFIDKEIGSGSVSNTAISIMVVTLANAIDHVAS